MQDIGLFMAMADYRKTKKVVILVRETCPFIILHSQAIEKKE